MAKTDRTRALRRNATRVELLLWNKIRSRQLGGFKFVRQETIGRYVVDFVCRECRLIVEVDGGQHSEAVEYDRQRDDWLKAQGHTEVHLAAKGWGTLPATFAAVLSSFVKRVTLKDALP